MGIHPCKRQRELHLFWGQYANALVLVCLRVEYEHLYLVHLYALGYGWTAEECVLSLLFCHFVLSERGFALHVDERLLLRFFIQTAQITDVRQVVIIHSDSPIQGCVVYALNTRLVIGVWGEITLRVGHACWLVIEVWLVLVIRNRHSLLRDELVVLARLNVLLRLLTITLSSRQGRLHTERGMPRWGGLPLDLVLNCCTHGFWPVFCSV